MSSHSPKIFAFWVKWKLTKLLAGVNLSEIVFIYPQCYPGDRLVTCPASRACSHKNTKSDLPLFLYPTHCALYAVHHYSQNQ